MALVLGCAMHGVSAQSLDTLLARVWATHPSLAAISYDYEAQLQTGTQVAQLPDPEVQLGYWLLPVETRTGPQRLRLGATQRLPYPGRLAAQQALADAKAQPLLEKRAAQALKLALDLRLAYFDGWRYAEEAAQLSAFLPIYELLEARVLARIESGQGSTVSAYQLALERQALDYRIAALAEKRAQPRARIAGLLGAPLTGPLAYTLPNYPLDTLAVRRAIAALETSHPRLRVYAEQLRVREAALALNEFAIKPDFAVGLDYVQVNERDDADPQGNGRDILGPRVGLRLPLNRKSYTAKREEEALRGAAIRSDRAALLLDLQTQIETTLVAYRLNEMEVDFIQQQLNTLPPALEVARAEYGEGRRPLEEVLRLEEKLLDYRLRHVDTRHRAATLVARLAYLLAVHPDQISTNE